MFDFFNKKKKKTNDVRENTLSEEQLSNINQAIDTKKSEITKVEKTATKAEQAKLYEELGLLYAQKNDDEAIPILEKSLERKLSMGDGYKKLMSLYNEKRKEAARNGDDAGIDKYMNKMDEMRSVAKKLTISGDK